VVAPGWRLKLNLGDLLKGGDEKKDERKRAAAKKAKDAAKRKKIAEKRGGGGYGGYGGYGGGYVGYDAWGTGGSGAGGSAYKSEKYYKDTIGEWTVTMDVKLNDAPPREGVSLLHTALIHSEETKGRTKLKPTEGEAVVNCDGGVGQLGTFGDVTKACVLAGKWHRVVVAVKVASGEGKKGELRTWVDTVPGCVLKSEAVVAGGRFEVDLDGLFLFSSSDPNMMPGNVSLRTVRVEQSFTNDKLVLENRARDRVLSMLNEERRRKVDAQRRGLSLAELFAKPRPVWATPALVGTFGDAFIEGTGFEGTSCLAWSFTVLNHALQAMLRGPNADAFLVGLDAGARSAVSDVMHVLSKSAATFKHMARLLKNPNAAQLMGFLRRIKKLVAKVGVGETLLLPAIVESSELLLLLVRKSEKYFDLVIVATDPDLALKHHAVNAAVAPPAIHFRTCMVVNNVDKKMATDDVFYAAVFNLTCRNMTKDTTGDMRRFYDVLIPFVTGKPLEQTLVETEAHGHPPPPPSPAASTAAGEAAGGGEAGEEVKEGGGGGGPVQGPWRLPQRSATAYVRCVFEAMNFMLTTRGLDQAQADAVHLALQAQLVDMVANDMQYVLPDENGRRVCEMALSAFSDATVRLAASVAEKDPASAFVATVPERVRLTVLRLGQDLAACAEDVEMLPPPLDLTGVRTQAMEDEARAAAAAAGKAYGRGRAGACVGL